MYSIDSGMYFSMDCEEDDEFKTSLTATFFMQELLFAILSAILFTFDYCFDIPKRTYFTVFPFCTLPPFHLFTFGFTFYFLESSGVPYFKPFPSSLLPAYNLNELLLLMLLLLSLLNTEEEFYLAANRAFEGE